MTPKIHHIFLFFYLSYFILCKAHNPSTLSNTNSPNAFDFLKGLNGTQKGDKEKGLSQLKKHLANLGYISNPIVHLSNDIFDDTLELAIKKYQNFYRINITGTLDSQTLTSMLRPRCGVADIINNDNVINTNTSFGDIKYVLSGSTWPPNKRYLRVSFPRGTRGDAYDPVKNALARWASVSPFKFNFIDNVEASDVKMSFQRWDHGDGSPFDGRGGALAHAAYPTYGILHFDADESWSTYAQKGEWDLQTVALHELGHTLGLAHSQDPNAIMYASIHAGEKKDLNNDDIQGIRAMYYK
ncbi:hypothetical protein CASFOL_034180 [Castilleja foliolosa]|uniref:Peptidase metallopeptidase domain-containing protein n=1 Tax=Castilleja foliolosa TaxID=1961234 RepID=A0ABD3BY22_9LAMI